LKIEERDGQHYIATEFVEGATLRELNKMSLQGVLDAAIQITSALAAAHASGIGSSRHQAGKHHAPHRRYIKVLDSGWPS